MKIRMNKKKFFGYLLMIIAVIIPLFLAGSMSLDILSQASKRDDFVKSYEKLSDEELSTIEEKTTEYNNKLNGQNLSVDPFASDGYDMDYKISDNPDAIFAYITVPSIDVSQPIYLGATEDHLIAGFGHVDGTSLPVGGQGTRSVIAGHRGGYYGRLDLLNAHLIKEGDILRIDIGKDILEYRMTSREVINPSDWEKLKPIEGKDMVTLLTCDPFPTAQNRMLVNFERVFENEDASNTTSIEEQPGADTKNLKDKRTTFFDTKLSSANTMKYGLFASTIILAIILIVLIVRFFGLFSKKNRISQ